MIPSGGGGQGHRAKHLRLWTRSWVWGWCVVALRAFVVINHVLLQWAGNPNGKSFPFISLLFPVVAIRREPCILVAIDSQEQYRFGDGVCLHWIDLLICYYDFKILSNLNRATDEFVNWVLTAKWQTSTYVRVDSSFKTIIRFTELNFG